MAKISIIIPLFNEERWIYNCLSQVCQADSLGLEKEIIIVDDGSTDGSLAEVRRFCAENNFIFRAKDKSREDYYRADLSLILLMNKQRYGKGYALRRGFSVSSGRVVLVQDSDLEYSPADYPLLIQPILDGRADVVYGSRFGLARPHRVLYFWHYLGNKLITTLSNVFTGFNLSDVEVGYKVFNGDLIRGLNKKLVSNDFGFEIEVTARLSRLEKLRIYEVGVSYQGRTYQEGKKINWLDGLKAVWYVVRFNLFTFNRDDSLHSFFGGSALDRLKKGKGGSK